MRKILLAAVAFLVVINCSSLDAGPFKRLKERRQAKTAVQHQPQYQQQQVCREGDPNCPDTIGSPTIGQLRINNEGGFEGQLTDQDFASYFQAKTATVMVANPVVVRPVSVEAKSEETKQPTVEEAIAIFREAKESLARAVKAGRQKAEITAINIEAQIKVLKIKQAAEIEALEDKIMPSTPPPPDMTMQIPTSSSITFTTGD